MNRRERITALLQWVALGSVVGVLCGLASALFLYLLHEATDYRNDHEWIVYTLPIAGLVIGWIYDRYGRSVAAGNNLVIDTIHDEGPQIPVRMAPMVLIGTVLTHLFGGSAGREGTAVQMGASMADAVAHRFRLDRAVRVQLIAAGVAGGFGSVFGTPIAGAIFGLEFITLGRLKYDTLVPALVASVVGDMVTDATGIQHALYTAAPATPLTPLLLLKWIAFGAMVAAVSTAFIELTHWIKKALEKRVAHLAFRMMLGGVAVVALWQLSGTSMYLGLGVPSIQDAFVNADQPLYAFAAKLLFTAVTLGAAFLGGEVTPLFFIGATLGNAFARIFDVPLALGAGVGMAAVFASASNAPLALSIMAVELLGMNILPHVVIVCVVAYLLSGNRSIYPAQRLLGSKSGTPFDEPVALRDLHAAPASTEKPDEPAGKDADEA